MAVAPHLNNCCSVSLSSVLGPCRKPLANQMQQIRDANTANTANTGCKYCKYEMVPHCVDILGGWYKKVPPSCLGTVGTSMNLVFRV